MKVAFSYGGGVQSVAAGRLVMAGKLPTPDLIIFADTCQEPLGVYEAVEREKALFIEHGIRFETVSIGDLGKLRPGKKNPFYTFTPLFTLRAMVNGKYKKGMMRRTCTQRFKIEPIQKLIKAQPGWKEEGVQLWLGISTDEVQRMKPSRVDWIENVYPLIDGGYSRKMLEAYLIGLGVVPTRSACVFCPFRSAASWRDIAAVPEDWAAAVAYDESIRHISSSVESFVHGSRKPLLEVVGLADSIPGLQDDECTGICMT
jgi:hypothetical protein